jgi:hypothetical protein
LGNGKTAYLEEVNLHFADVDEHTLANALGAGTVDGGVTFAGIVQLRTGIEFTDERITDKETRKHTRLHEDSRVLPIAGQTAINNGTIVLRVTIHQKETGPTNGTSLRTTQNKGVRKTIEEMEVDKISSEEISPNSVLLSEIGTQRNQPTETLTKSSRDFKADTQTSSSQGPKKHRDSRPVSQFHGKIKATQREHRFQSRTLEIHASFPPAIN